MWPVCFIFQTFVKSSSGSNSPLTDRANCEGYANLPNGYTTLDTSFVCDSCNKANEKVKFLSARNEAFDITASDPYSAAICFTLTNEDVHLSDRASRACQHHKSPASDGKLSSSGLSTGACMTMMDIEEPSAFFREQAFPDLLAPGPSLLSLSSEGTEDGSSFGTEAGSISIITGAHYLPDDVKASRWEIHGVNSMQRSWLTTCDSILSYNVNSDIGKAKSLYWDDIYLYTKMTALCVS